MYCTKKDVDDLKWHIDIGILIVIIVGMIALLISRGEAAPIDGRPDVRPLDNDKIVSVVRGYGNGHWGIDYS